MNAYNSQLKENESEANCHKESSTDHYAPLSPPLGMFDQMTKTVMGTDHLYQKFETDKHFQHHSQQCDFQADPEVKMQVAGENSQQIEKEKTQV